LNVEIVKDEAKSGEDPTKDNEKIKIDIVPASGEAIVGTKDGVEYVLQFGKIAGIESTSDEDKETADAKSADGKGKADQKAKDDATKEGTNPDTLKITENKDVAVNRYVMVTARFNPNLLTKPELEPLPEIKTAPKKDDDKKGDDGKKASDAKSEDKGAKKADETNTEADIEAQEARREKIEKENKRKQDDYDDKVKKGQERARELNARFADWYYVVNDATFRKIHLGAGDVIMQKPKEEKDSKAGAATPTDPFNRPKGATQPKGASKAAPAPAKK
jgi:hypothetical protein